MDFNALVRRAMQAAANANQPDMMREIQRRIQSNPELAARAAQPTEAALNPFVQRSMATAQQRGDARINELLAQLPPNATSDDVLALVLGRPAPRFP